jgi:hypothetical protein
VMSRFLIELPKAAGMALQQVEHDCCAVEHTAT